MLKENERIDDLMYKGLQLIQHQEGYCFTQDSVILSHFVKASAKETLVDLGTGSGILAILAAKKTQASSIIGIELQERLADMALRSVALNKLHEKVRIVKGDIKEAYTLIGEQVFDVVCTNPPYMASKKDSTAEIDICKYEIAITLQEVIKSADRLLKYGGRFYMVHRADRLADIVDIMRGTHIEPKRLIPIQPTAEKIIDTVVIEGKKGGKPSLVFERPIIIYNQKGELTPCARKIYNLD